MKNVSIIKIAVLLLLSFVVVSCMDFVGDDIKNAVNGVEITLTLDLDGGIGVESLTGKQCSDLVAPSDPIKTGYVFAGWNPALPKKFPNKNAVYTAMWRLEDDWAINYNLDGGTNAAKNPASYNIETPTITLAAPTKNGYAFDGWYEEEDYSGTAMTQIAQGTIGGITLWAKWICAHTVNRRNADGNFTCVCGAKEFLKTSETAVIIDATTVCMEDDSAWSGYYGGVSADYKGVFIADREITLSPYAMGKYEVTQELFEAVMGENPSHFTSEAPMLSGETQELRPVERVNWYHAIAFCNKLSILCGLEPCYQLNEITDWANLLYSEIPLLNNAKWNKVTCDLKKNGYRLPTETEWEFAARGGDAEKPEWKYSYSGVNTEKTAENFTSAPNSDSSLDEYAWYWFNLDGNASAETAIVSGTAGFGTHEVGTKKPNTLGLYDMSGNVFEWCWDFLVALDTVAVTDPVGPEVGSYRIWRGGSWISIFNRCAVSFRNNVRSPNSRDYYLGFRLARSLTMP